MATVTCHTEGCENANVAIDVTTEWTDEDGETQHVDDVVCGVCGQPITDQT
jgi:YgiT-type zinc finger domain-containing protein